MLNKKISLILLLLSFFVIVGSVSACDDTNSVIGVVEGNNTVPINDTELGQCGGCGNTDPIQAESDNSSSVIDNHTSLHTESKNKNTTSSIDSKDVVMSYRDGTRFVATFFDENGNPLNGTTVQFIFKDINTVYERNTDDNGVAALCVNLNPGHYIVTVHNTVTGENKDFTLIVLYSDYNIYKQLESDNMTCDYNVNSVIDNHTSVHTESENNDSAVNKTNNITGSIDSKDVVMTCRDGTRFVATFFDENGNPLNGTTVQFIFKDINTVYERNTDDNGVAALCVNLNPGHYIVTVHNTVTGENKDFTLIVLDSDSNIYKSNA